MGTGFSREYRRNAAYGLHDVERTPRCLWRLFGVYTVESEVVFRQAQREAGAGVQHRAKIKGKREAG